MELEEHLTRLEELKSVRKTIEKMIIDEESVIEEKRKSMIVPKRYLRSSTTLMKNQSTINKEPVDALIPVSLKTTMVNDNSKKEVAKKKTGKAEVSKKKTGKTKVAKKETGNKEIAKKKTGKKDRVKVFSYLEKLDLARGIYNLPRTKLAQVVLILRNGEKMIRDSDPDEIDFDVLKLKNKTIRDLKLFVDQ